MLFREFFIFYRTRSVLISFFSLFDLRIVIIVIYFVESESYSLYKSFLVL